MTTYITQEQVKGLYEKTVNEHVHYPVQKSAVSQER